MKAQLDDYIMENLDRIYRFAYNRLRNEYNAEDVTQDIILTAMRNVDNIKDPSKLDAWFWGVARNVYMQSLNAKREVPTEESMIIDISGIHYTTPESEYMKNIDTSNVRRAISYLGKMYRDVAVLYYIEEKDYNTIAEELSIPLSSVKWRLNQSKQQLKEELVKMDTNYMANGYRKAVDYNINRGGFSKGYNDYGGAEKALDNLLAKNICLTIYNTAKTVTEISNDLGVSADYIEYHIEEMVNSGAITQISNKYQTNFPIVNRKQYTDMYIDMYNVAIRNSVKILDKIYELKNELATINYNCDKEFDTLIVMLTMIIAKETKDNIFDVENLPFKDIDQSWYILGTPKENDIKIELGGGLNWYDTEAAYIYNASVKNEMWHFEGFNHEVLIKYYKTSLLDLNDEKTKNAIADLIEEGQLTKCNDTYRINAPIVSYDDYNKLLEILHPVIDIANEIQKNIISEANKHVKKYISSRLDSELFFTRYFAHNIINAALLNNIKNKDIEITRDMTTWYVVKSSEDSGKNESYVNKGNR